MMKYLSIFCLIIIKFTPCSSQINTFFSSELEFKDSITICSNCIKNFEHSDNIVLHQKKFEKENVIELNKQFIQTYINIDNCGNYSIDLSIFTNSDQEIDIFIGDIQEKISVKKKNSWQSKQINFNLFRKGTELLRIVSNDTLFVNGIFMQKRCTPNLILNETVILSSIINASQQVLGKELVLRDDTQINITAGSEIVLKSGFEVQRGAILTAEIKSCYSIINCEDHKEIIQRTLKIYNYVSANDDGANDYFEIENLQEFNHYTLVIFNETGEKIYKTEDYHNDWNGEFNESGTYFYKLIIHDLNESVTGGIYLSK